MPYSCAFHDGNKQTSLLPHSLPAGRIYSLFNRTIFKARAAFYALILIHGNLEKTDPVKERIDSAQRAGCAAVRPFAYYHPCKKACQNKALYNKYCSDKMAKIRII